MLISEYLNTPKSMFYNFNFLCQYILEHDCLEIAALCMTHNVLKEEIGDGYELKKEDIMQYANSTSEGIFKTPFVGGATLWDCISDFKQNIDKYIWLYNILEDQQSKDTLHRIMLFRLFFDINVLEECYVEVQYFIPDILPKRENAVYVDCGTYDGYTTKLFIEVYRDYHKIYTYEPMPDNYKVLCDALKNYDNVVSFNRGISNQNAEMKFTSHLPNAANRIHPYGDVIVPISTLDGDIDEPITFIKMDIEGAEQSALYGAQNHIVQDNPQLAICVYHTVQDIWKIPQIIYSFNKYQKFYLRYHGHNNQEEIVFYADPYIGDALQAMKEKIDKNSMSEHLAKADQLIQTVQEGISFTLSRLSQDDYSSCKDMLDLIKEALSSCISSVDAIRNNL